MSRFIRTAGSTGTEVYTDDDVCRVISSGAPCVSSCSISSCSISSSNGYNICDLRSGWERIYYESCLGCIGSSVEFLIDSEKYDSFCLSLRNFNYCTTANSCIICLTTGVACGSTYFTNCCCPIKSVGVDKSCPANVGSYGCQRCWPTSCFSGVSAICCTQASQGFNYGVKFDAQAAGILAQDNFWGGSYINCCSPYTGRCGLYYLNWSWSSFKKFRVSSNVAMKSSSKGTIELLGKKISPSIGVV
jgi:hypothetical protein